MKNILKRICSIEKKGFHKVFTFMGGKIKIRDNKAEIRQLRNELEQVRHELNELLKVSSSERKNNQQLRNEIAELRRKTNYRFQRYASPDKYVDILKDWFLDCTGQILNLENPETFNEKLQWMKLYDSTPLKTKLADKYLVREWVTEKIGGQYLIPLLGVWDRFEEIDFDKLPKRFVLKCNHGSGYNIIVRDKSRMDLKDMHRRVSLWMNENFAYRNGLELHYSDIEPKIIAEAFIEQKSDGDLYDYKFWCFEGKVKYIQFFCNRNTTGARTAFYDTDWVKQDFVYGYPMDVTTRPRPDNLEDMITLAEKLAIGFSFVRVDFYRMDDGRLYFGEMTCTSFSGVGKWIPEEANLHMGKLLELSVDK